MDTSAKQIEREKTACIVLMAPIMLFAYLINHLWQIPIIYHLSFVISHLFNHTNNSVIFAIIIRIYSTAITALFLFQIRILRYKTFYVRMRFSFDFLNDLICKAIN